MRRTMLGIIAVALVAASGTACASKRYVNTRVDEVNERVTTLSGSVEENQERILQNEGRIGEVDERVGQVDGKAEAAATAAEGARSAADSANDRAEAIEAASRRLVYEVVLSEDQGGFQFGRTTLPDTAMAELDKMISDLTAEPQAVFFEIEGHTDSVGTEAINERIGLERAEAVKRYLYETHQVPLHKINVISYGESKPIAPNDNSEGRAQNRRIVVRVVA